MAGNLVVKLTEDQQKQIKDATGQSVAEISIRSGAGQLSDQELDQVGGGLIGLFTSIPNNTITGNLTGNINGGTITGNIIGGS